MPNQYRKKVCPNCQKEHRQRGPFCSKSCSNEGRDPEVYRKHSDWMKYSDRGQEIVYNLHNDLEDEPPVAGGIAQTQQDFYKDNSGDLWMPIE